MSVFSSRPSNKCFGLCVKSPEMNADMADANYRPHTPRSGFEIGMAEKASNETGCLNLRYIQKNQAIVCMATPIKVKTLDTAAKGRLIPLVKERIYLVVLPPLSSDFMPYLMHANPPSAQELTLVLRNIFIKTLVRLPIPRHVRERLPAPGAPLPR